MKSKQEMEAQVLHIVDRTTKNQRGDEDSFVELKSKFPDDFQKTARQIAALCNAAQGSEAIWVIGVDEKGGQTLGVDTTDLESWWPQVEKFFDEFTPEMRSINVPIGNDGTVVVGMFFTSDRTPYVVKTGMSGGVEREVPWRSGNRTRSAKRGEILRLLNPEKRLPEMELLRANGNIDCSARHAAPRMNPGTGEQVEAIEGPGVYFYFTVQVFVEAVNEVTFPTHRSRGSITVPQIFDNHPLEVDFSTSNHNTTWIEANNHAALVKKPTTLTLSCRGYVDVMGDTDRTQDMEFERLVTDLRATKALTLGIVLEATEGRGRWESTITLHQAQDREEQLAHRTYFRWETA
ncbi:MAG TPA: hypothetical protein VG674_00615 [Amycolatopsis sp.]|nr:hypothetical protein [Amycolatopsis sp.]